MNIKKIISRELSQYRKHLGKALPYDARPKETNESIPSRTGVFDPQPESTEPVRPFDALAAGGADTFIAGPFEMAGIYSFQQFAQWDLAAAGVRYRWGSIIISGGDTQANRRTNAEVRIVEQVQQNAEITVEQAFGTQPMAYTGADFDEVAMGSFIYHLQESEIPDVIEFWGRECPRQADDVEVSTAFGTRSVTMMIRGRFWR